MKKLLFISILVLLKAGLFAQILDVNERLSLKLSDGQMLELYKARNSAAYYYLPANLRLSEVDGKPEFSFLSYDEDGDGKAEGAIMHLLLSWGLEKEQEAEAIELLKEAKGEQAMIWGAVSIQASGEPAWNFYHSKDKKITELLWEELKAAPQTPVFPGAKWAASFSWDAEGSERMQELLKDEEELKQIFLEMNFQIKGLGDVQLKTSFYQLIGALTLDKQE